jgi:peptide deformylase
VSLLGIRVLGDPILRQDTTVVTDFGESLRALVDDMFQTMYVAQGIGLAAPQVGRRERVAVIDVRNRDGGGDAPFAIVNPRILAFSEETDRDEEGCLSIPDIYGDVERPTSIVVEAQDVNGQSFTLEAHDLLARCLQHEIDHLHGKLFIDYLSVLKRRAAQNKWAKERDKYPGNLRVLSAAEVAKHHTRNEEL